MLKKKNRPTDAFELVPRQSVWSESVCDTKQLVRQEDTHLDEVLVQRGSQGVFWPKRRGVERSIA